jgi:tryptophan synthase alpha chain
VVQTARAAAVAAVQILDADTICRVSNTLCPRSNRFHLIGPKQHGRVTVPPMNRIDATFGKLREQGKSAFVAYICAGDPTLDLTFEIVQAMDRWGVDIVELGVPFSDPMADGTVNQQAAERALHAGATVPGVLDLVRRIRSVSQIPVVLYTYMNPVYTFGFARFLTEATEAGVDGLLLLDLPPEEQDANEELQAATDLRLIRLIAPTTPEDRMARIAARASGFIYYVSREGVTGERSDIATDLDAQLALIRKYAQVPIVVGFGVSRPEHAAAIAAKADGVVVGSAIVRQIAALGQSADLIPRLEQTVKPLVDATH